MAFLFIVNDEYDGETINDRLHVLLTRGRDSFQKPDPSLSNKWYQVVAECHKRVEKL